MTQISSVLLLFLLLLVPAQQVDVKGPNAHPIFTFLKSDEQAGTKEIGWNFEKFLVDRRGKVAARYKTIVNPMKMESKIVELLNQSS